MCFSRYVLSIFEIGSSIENIVQFLITCSASRQGETCNCGKGKSVPGTDGCIYVDAYMLKPSIAGTNIYLY